MAAILLGLEDLEPFVRTARGEPVLHQWLLAIQCSSEKVLCWCVSLSSQLPDAVFSILVEDERIPLVLQAIDQEICEELQCFAKGRLAGFDGRHGPRRGPAASA